MGGGKAQPRRVSEMSPLDRGPRATGGIFQGVRKGAALRGPAAAMLERPTLAGPGGSGVVGESIQARGVAMMSVGARNGHVQVADREKRAGSQFSGFSSVAAS